MESRTIHSSFQGSWPFSICRSDLQIAIPRSFEPLAIAI
jgi:hypothetical protein